MRNSYAINKGHTLLEMVIVLSIMLIASFSFRINFSSRSLEAFGLSVRSMFFLAKSFAIHSGRTHGIFFREDGYIELYDSYDEITVNLENIESGKNRLIKRINMKGFPDIGYGILPGGVPDPSNPDMNIPDEEKPIKMGTQNIMHIKPAGGVTNGSVYITDSDDEYMLCIRTAYAYTRIFLYYYDAETGIWIIL